MTDELTVTPVDEFDVDVQGTLEQKLSQRGLDATYSTYEQPMIVATMRRKVGKGEYSTYKIELPANVVATQEELDEMVEEKIENVL